MTRKPKPDFVIDRSKRRRRVCRGDGVLLALLGAAIAYFVGYCS